MAVSAKQRKFSVVVAVCKGTRGIGAGGQLPWRLRSDMQYFKQLTRSTSDATKRNAVIMGRKTWQSIPTKFRPLDDRVNVVLSRNPEAKKELDLPEGVVVAESLEKALELLAEDAELGCTIENVYVIGGGSVYAEALALKQSCAKLYVTEIEKAEPPKPAAVAANEAENTGSTNTPPPSGAAVEGAKPAASAFDCDTFFPALPSEFYGAAHPAQGRGWAALRVRRAGPAERRRRRRRLGLLRAVARRAAARGEPVPRPRARGHRARRPAARPHGGGHALQVWRADEV